jgi:thiamine transport system permease protein
VTEHGVALGRAAGWARRALFLAPLAFLGLFYFYPVARILSLSFGRSAAGPLAPFAEALRATSTRQILWFTVWQAAVSTVLTLMLGLPGAYVLARYRFPGRSLLRALTGVAFVMPTLVVAAAFNALLGPHGWVNRGLVAGMGLGAPPIHFTNTLAAILIAHVFYNTTIVLRLVGDFWSRLSPRLGQAAAVLGADRWRVARHVTLPLLMPAVAAAALLVFLFDFTSFGVILILGGPRFTTLEVEIYTQTVSLFNLPLAAVLALLQLGCTLMLTLVYTLLAGRVSRPISLRTAEQTARVPNTWRQWLAVGTVVSVLLLMLVLPLAALALASVSRLTPAGDPALAGFTLDNYRALTSNARQSMFYRPPSVAIAMSLLYATVTVALALALALPTALAVGRDGNSRLARLSDPLIMLPLGTSAVTLGLGFLVAFNRAPLALRDSPLLVPLAHTLVAFPFVVRVLTPALASIQPRLHQAAAVLGASPGRTLSTIDLPLLAPAIAVGAIFAFTISLGEFGATALIARPEYPTVPLAIYRFLSRPGATNYGQALALATLLMLLTAGGMLIIERLGPRGGRLL